MELEKEFSTAKDTAKQWGVSIRMISFYCTHHKIPGATKLGSMWFIPKSAVKPVDHRCKKAKD